MRLTAAIDFIVSVEAVLSIAATDVSPDTVATAASVSVVCATANTSRASSRLVASFTAISMVSLTFCMAEATELSNVLSTDETIA